MTIQDAKIATSGRPEERGVTMEDLAAVPLSDLREQIANPGPVLAAILRRIMKPADQDKVTVSAFGSAL